MPLELDDQYSFVRTIKYNRKDNDNPFLIKYYGNNGNGVNREDV